MHLRDLIGWVYDIEHTALIGFRDHHNQSIHHDITDLSSLKTASLVITAFDFHQHITFSYIQPLKSRSEI
jgi:hypothetical protein